MPAAVYVCQGGCGTFEEDASKLHPRGVVNQRHYCEQCVKEIDKYLQARDELHTRLAVEWSEGLMKLTSEYAAKGRRLPDGG
jgi:hypothetical protein